MKKTHRWVTLTILLLAALVSYSYGFSTGPAIFIALGIILELTFWFRLFDKKR